MTRWRPNNYNNKLRISNCIEKYDTKTIENS